MKNRIISGAIMTLLVAMVLYFGGIIFKIAIGIVSILAFRELVDVNKKNIIPLGMKIVGLICMLSLIFLTKETENLLFGLNYENLSIVFLAILGPTVFLKKSEYNVQSAFYLMAISLFLGVVFNLFIALFNTSVLQFIYIILVACITDIFALFGGKLIGKHPLTKISPNKTIEGSIIGTIVALIIASTFYITLIDSSNIISIVILTVILSIIGQIGDLFFSLIKRENDVKDFSNLIPGHGGILDRLDSIIFIIMAFVFLIRFISYF